MNKLSKILNIVLIALLGVTLVFAGMFFFGGDVEGAAYETPVYTDLFLNWGIVLVFLTAGITILFEIISLVLQPKNAMRSLISIAVLAVIVFISYSIGDPTPLVLPGYEGTDNVASMLLLSDMFLYSTYFLVGILIVAILYSEVSRIFR
ncbi:hypothetical protein ACT3CD_04050 [Geofilum sp. OHC36d9]|uniref:hypothetical protein n=1 Tax=Geofilum sp. OHC36d9 TaxID=3458413 RepID=UPI00403366F3